ncbi:MAG: hypothetical protein H6709_21435 [Kofleriaceae bacterium]|nr:hypothetical protein [Myxococcales bacterium]MCB9574648.1 hypothetical protein [Kofleriaceae bacterium]
MGAVLVLDYFVVLVLLLMGLAGGWHPALIAGLCLIGLALQRELAWLSHLLDDDDKLR